MTVRAPYLLLMLSLLLGGCSFLSGPPAEPIDLKISKQGPWQTQDQLLWKQSGHQLQLDITSPAGVGSARVRPEAGLWPETVLLRLHLTALEGFFATTGSERFEYQLSHEENNQRAKERAAGQHLEPIEIRLPASLFDDPQATLIIQWVDFYR